MSELARNGTELATARAGRVTITCGGCGRTGTTRADAIPPGARHALCPVCDAGAPGTIARGYLTRLGDGCVRPTPSMPSVNAP